MKRFLLFFPALYIWLVSGGVFLFATILGIIVFNIVPAKKVHPVYKRLLRLVFVFAFVRVKKINTPKISKDKSYIFMANHTSLIDVPLMGAYLPIFVNALEAHTHFQWPVYRHLIKAYGQIPINRSSPGKSLQSYNQAAEKVKNNTSIIVFPEGHRTKNGKLQRFKKLPFMIAKKAETEIIPIGINGMWKLSGGESFFLRPTKLTMNFGNPISTQDIEKLSANELADKVQSQIAELMNETIPKSRNY
ncbi:MAG: lysophospholipid acyltransferase family protein [Bacteroidota bacterium]|nr:lysophospholipid acyltransferase family protein [Bacteroidota bacterium]